ncbi:MAG: prepilin peptidase [Candidatus Buchananbacteria bacterium]
MIGLFIFVLGLVVGSFLNVVILRLGTKKSFWQGRSICPHCQQKIAGYDNIPIISFIILVGRCRHCQAKISWQYPLVELATGLIFVWLYWHAGFTLTFFVWAVFACLLLIIFVYDLKKYLILDQVTIPAIIFAFLANLFLGLGFWNLILAAAIGSGFFALQFFVSRGKWVGDGDIRLGALMGLMLGWKYLLVALFIAYLLGSAFGILLIILGKKKMSSAVPFGPFLTLATLITLIYGQSLLFWYLNLLYR